MESRISIFRKLVHDCMRDVPLAVEDPPHRRRQSTRRHRTPDMPRAAKISHAESRPNRSPAPSQAKPSNTKRCKGMILTNSDCSTPTPYQPVEAFFIV